jgi:hypothetical protein
VTGPMPKGPRLALVALLVVAVAWLGFRAVRAFDQDRHKAEAAAVLAAPDTVTHPLAPVVNGPAVIGRPPPPFPDTGAPEQGAPNSSDFGASEQGAPNSPDSGASEQGAPNSPDTGAPEREGSPQPGTAGGTVHSPLGQLSYRPETWLTVVDLRGLAPVAEDERYLVFLRNWAGWTLAGAAKPGPDGEAQVRSAAEPRPPTIYEVVVTRAVDDATSVPHGEPLLHWFDGSIAPPRARQFDFARGA